MIEFISLLGICVIALLLFLLFLLTKAPEAIKDKRPMIFSHIQKEIAKRDCDVETLYSVEDEQCDAICKPPGLYRSHNGICVNLLVFNNIDVTEKCDPKRGVLAYLMGDAQFGRMRMSCISIDPGIQMDNPSIPNRLCTHGKINIDYIKSFPHLSDCQCQNSDILALIANTSAIRQRGVCVDKSMHQLLQNNELLYSGQNI